MSSSEERAVDLNDLAGRIVETYEECGGIHHLNHSPLPSYRAIVDILADLRELIYPGYGRRQNLHMRNVIYHVGDLIENVHGRLAEQISRSLLHKCRSETTAAEAGAKAGRISLSLIEAIPEIRRALAADAEAAIAGDPAAQSLDEVIFCYPGLSAITVFRIANHLHRLGTPLIPRMMTEYAHSKTGIDIHPGATIGNRFFIDHGTGVVIGETTTIGDDVKLYQGVTLGALSFPRDESGRPLRGIKRHPTIEHDVVIYANATILGGDTVIGHHSVVGSSAWVTSSIAPHTTVTIESPRLKFREKANHAG